MQTTKQRFTCEQCNLIWDVLIYPYYPDQKETVIGIKSCPHCGSVIISANIQYYWSCPLCMGYHLMEESCPFDRTGYDEYCPHCGSRKNQRFRRDK